MADRKPIVLVSGQLQQIQTGDTVPVANGGTGAVDASGARTNLGLVIGTNVQAWDADLDAIAALGSTGFAVRTAADTWAQRSVAGTAGRITVTNGDGVSGNPTIDLDTLADGGGGSFLKFTRDTYGRVSGTSAVTASDIGALVDTRYVRLDQDTTLDLDVTIKYNSSTTTFVDDDLVPKRYVDSVAQGLDHKASVRVATTTAGTLASSFENGDTIDGITLATNDRILIKDQAAPAENGIYIVQATGAPTRATDMDAWSEVPGAYVWVEVGTTNADSAWVCTSDQGGTLGTTAIDWVLFASAGSLIAGNGLTKTGDAINVVTADSTRIAVAADSIDLGTPTIGGSGSGSDFTKVSVDTYGRISSTGTATPADIGAQAADSDLTALANTATTGIYVITGTGTSTTRTITATGPISVTNGDGVAAAPNITTSMSTDRLIGRTTASTGVMEEITVGSGLSLAAGTLSATGTGVNSQSTLTNNTGSAIVIGNTVYISASGEITKAIANADAASRAVGVTSETINNTASGGVVTAGEITATTGEWDTITGGTGGLTFGAVYYLDNATAGRITTTAPGSGYVQPIGIALSTTKLKVHIGPRVQL